MKVSPDGRWAATLHQQSLSFRFEKGGTALDAQSRSNVEILAQQLERN